MTVSGGARAWATGLLATVLLCAGCSEQATTGAADPGGGATTGSTASSVPAPSAEPGRDGADGQATPTKQPSRLQTPDTHAGSMSIGSFPTPRQLGKAWDYAVDPGSVEEGYLGNGTPALERDPGEVARTAVPLGCPRTGEMPTPDLALEVDYTVDGARVVAIRSAFADHAAAAAFFTARADHLRACEGRVELQAVGVLVGHLRRLGDGVLVSDRTPDSPASAWRELAVLDRDTVVLVATELRPDGPSPTPHELRRLAQRFRA